MEADVAVGEVPVATCTDGGEVDADVEALVDHHDGSSVAVVVVQHQSSQTQRSGGTAASGRTLGPPEGLDLRDRARTAPTPVAGDVPYPGEL
jgi:hypothetical protein